MIGGLGNQMFIYAMYMDMVRRFPNTRIDLSDMQHYHAHNGYELHDVFQLPRNEFCTWQPLKKVMEFLFFRVVLERHQNLDTLEAYRCSYAWPLVYFKGFYQDERYFLSVESEVREAFRFDETRLNAESREWLQRITQDEKAVALHVRRGDYLQGHFWDILGRVCQKGYYQRAVEAALERVPDAHFYVFSNDQAWVKENLQLPQASFIDCNHGADSWQDMLLMSRCRHNVICNSSFSWWAAWLNANPEKLVFCPNHWYAGDENPRILPSDWLRVECEG